MIIVTNRKKYLKAQKKAKYGEVIIWNENLTLETTKPTERKEK